jgi:hypothetical protein
MSLHSFIVTVEVDRWPSGDNRLPQDYALTALNCATLPDASRLDSFADLPAEASVVDVQPLP